MAENNHGGARKGAGRKRLETGKERVKFWISCTASEKEAIQKLAEAQNKTNSELILETLGVRTMEKYIFSSLGKGGTPIAIIEAYNYEEAIEKFGEVDDKIPSFKRFEKHYTSGLYEVKKIGAANPEYIIHSNRSFN